QKIFVPKWRDIYSLVKYVVCRDSTIPSRPRHEDAGQSAYDVYGSTRVIEGGRSCPLADFSQSRKAATMILIKRTLIPHGIGLFYLLRRDTLSIGPRHDRSYQFA